MTDRKPQTEDKYVVRFPDGLRDRIKAAAAANGRSMNAEIIFTLEDAYPPEPTIEDTIYYANMIVNDYQDTPDYARLRQLRDALKELVGELQKGREEGYPETEMSQWGRELKPDSPKG